MKSLPHFTFGAQHTTSIYGNAFSVGVTRVISLLHARIQCLIYTTLQSSARPPFRRFGLFYVHSILCIAIPPAAHELVGLKESYYILLGNNICTLSSSCFI